MSLREDHKATLIIVGALALLATICDDRPKPIADTEPESADESTPDAMADDAYTDADWAHYYETR